MFRFTRSSHRIPPRPRLLGRLAAVLAAASLVACGSIPRDPEETLKEVRNGEMRVGVAEAEPWTKLDDGDPSGVEVELMEDFAATLDARVRWFPGSAEDLLTALELGELDAVVGGFTATNPWSTRVAFTHPYLTTQLVVAVPRGRPLPEDIAGLRVAVEAGTEAAGLLEKTDAVPVPVQDLSGVGSPAAVEVWLLDELGLKDTGVRLKESDHVVAVHPGENAWQVALERFLLERQQRAVELLDREGKP